jgi:hypothetical protein
MADIIPWPERYRVVRLQECAERYVVKQGERSRGEPYLAQVLNGIAGRMDKQGIDIDLIEAECWAAMEGILDRAARMGVPLRTVSVDLECCAIRLTLKPPRQATR